MKKTTKTTTTKKAARKTTNTPAATEQATKTPKTKRATAKAKTESKKATTEHTRADSKKAIVLGLLHRDEGATIAQIGEVTGWQKHTIRGFLSIAGKTQTIESTKNDSGERIYRANA